MYDNILRFHLVVSIAATCFASAASPVGAITVMRDPVQGAGIVDVEGGVPLILGAPAETPLEVDFVFNEMRHIELMDNATTNIEFGIGNTGNNADLDYRIVFDLSDMHGNLITNEALVVENTATAGTIHIMALDLTPLPPVIFHDFHIRVETEFIDPNTGNGLFDLYVAGGGGDLGTSVSGPIRFNRAVVGEWVPEPSSMLLGLVGLGGLVVCGRRRAPPTIAKRRCPLDTLGSASRLIGRSHRGGYTMPPRRRREMSAHWSTGTHSDPRAALLRALRDCGLWRGTLGTR